MIKIPVENIELEGELQVFKEALGIVIFVHGSGSSRHSPRNKIVARELNKEGHATFLFDLLTKEEDALQDSRFDINLLTKRLLGVIDFLQKNPQTKSLKIGLFGASTGAAAALQAAAELKRKIAAVVSRGGRPDLAGESLVRVVSPTLLLVGSKDEMVIELNEAAFNELNCEKKLEIVEGASHLFEEPGTLMQVAHLSSKWFRKNF